MYKNSDGLNPNGRIYGWISCRGKISRKSIVLCSSFAITHSNECSAAVLASYKASNLNFFFFASRSSVSPSIFCCSSNACLQLLVASNITTSRQHSIHRLCSYSINSIDPSITPNSSVAAVLSSNGAHWPGPRRGAQVRYSPGEPSIDIRRPSHRSTGSA